MKQQLPTIAAFVMLAIALVIAFFITADQTPVKNKTDLKDVEIIINNPEPQPQPVTAMPESSKYLFVDAYSFFKNKLNTDRKYVFTIIDSYEIEIGDYWREVLNKFEYFEYYKAFPEAFIRRLIFMPTFTGNKELSEADEIDDKPVVYPDNDYRSFKYRVSLVPDTIDFLKNIADFFFLRIKKCLIF